MGVGGWGELEVCTATFPLPYGTLTDRRFRL